MIRILDIVLSVFILTISLPFLLLITFLILLESNGGIIYKQIRVGQYGKDFILYKFRTMFVNSDKHALLTVGARDPRITKTGYYLRKFKLDEFPQFINVIKGDMSIVGPRPEVRKYVDLYTKEQKKF